MKIASKVPRRPRRVLGIDPGTNVLGYALVEENGSQRRLLRMGVERFRGSGQHAEKLQGIFSFVLGILDAEKPEEMAIESPFFGKNIQSMLKLGRAQGVCMAAAMSREVPVCEYAPKKIKMSVTGNGNASKEQMAALLASTMGFAVGDHPLDATDALATALCHLNQNQIPGVGNTTSYSGWKQFLQDNPDREGKRPA